MEGGRKMKPVSFSMSQNVKFSISEVRKLSEADGPKKKLQQTVCFRRFDGSWWLGLQAICKSPFRGTKVLKKTRKCKVSEKSDTYYKILNQLNQKMYYFWLQL